MVSENRVKKNCQSPKVKLDIAHNKLSIMGNVIMGTKSDTICHNIAVGGRRGEEDKQKDFLLQEVWACSEKKRRQ